MLNRGFNLIEIMITLIIAAFLGAISIYAYSSYTLRSKVASMIAAGSPAQFAVVNDYFNQGSSFTGIDYSSGSAPFTTAQVNYVSSIAIVDGVITITGNSTNLLGNSITVRLTPSVSNNDFTWTCAITAAYLYLAPKSCQNTI